MSRVNGRDGKASVLRAGLGGFCMSVLRNGKGLRRSIYLGREY